MVEREFLTIIQFQIMKKLRLFITGLFILLAFAQCKKENGDNEIPYETIEAITQDSVSSIFQKIVTGGNVHDALPTLANRLLQMEEVESAEVNNYDINITFSDKTEHIIMFRFNNEQAGKKGFIDVPSFKKKNQTKNIDSDKKKVIVWEPFNLENDTNSFSGLVRLMEQEDNIETQYMSYQQCDISSLNSLTGFDYIVIHTHGSEGGDWIATREFATQEKDRQYRDKLRNGTLCRATIHEIATATQDNRPKTVYAVSGKYINSIQGRFDNSIIYGGFCHSMDESGGIRKALLAKGNNAAFVGFHGSVWNYYNLYICTAFSDYLINDMMTSGDAYEIVHQLVPDLPMYDPNGLVFAPNEFRFDESSNRNARLFDLPPIPVEGLVAYYPFNGNANDVSSNGNDGEVIGNVTLDYDRKGICNSAYRFYGEPYNYISVPDNESLHISTFTLNAWVYTDADDYSNGYLICKGRDINDGSYHLTVRDVCAETEYGGNNTAYIEEIPAVQEWHMITGVVEGDQIAFYVDGQLQASNTLSHPYLYDNSDPLTLGMHYFSGVPDYWTYPLLGILDDVRIYNRALNAMEIQALYYE